MIMTGTILKFVTMLVPAAILVTGQAYAASCSPSDNTSRILASPDPDDVHPDWSGESYIGSSWSVEVKRRVDADTGTYLKGDLISPRGELVTPNVYIIEDEWDCE